MDMTNRLYTLAEVAELMAVDPRTVKRWAKDGKLAVIMTPGGKYRVPAAEVERLMSAEATNGQISANTQPAT